MAIQELEIGRTTEKIFARLGGAYDNSKEEAVILHNETIRALRAEGYRFRLQLLYGAGGYLKAHRVGIFDSVGLIEERIYDLMGHIIKSQSHTHLLLRDDAGKIPLNW